MLVTPFDIVIVIFLSNLAGFMAAEAIHLYYLDITND